MFGEVSRQLLFCFFGQCVAPGPGIFIVHTLATVTSVDNTPSVLVYSIRTSDFAFGRSANKSNVFIRLALRRGDRRGTGSCGLALGLLRLLEPVVVE